MEKSLETPHTDMMLMWGEGEGVGLGELEGRRGRGERIGASSAPYCSFLFSALCVDLLFSLCCSTLLLCAAADAVAVTLPALPTHSSHRPR